MAMTMDRMLPATRVCLSPEDRRRLADLIGLDARAASSDLDRLEAILNDHRFITGVFDHPKPNEVRDLIAPRKSAGLKKKAEALAEALRTIPWQLSADFRAGGFDVQGFQDQLERFVPAADAVLALYDGETTARRPAQQVRDRHTIPEIAELFDRMCGRGVDAERDWEHLDNLCSFVTFALERAGIPCPDAGDTKLGEQNQGRLRRLLKTRGRAQGRRPRVK